MTALSHPVKKEENCPFILVDQIGYVLTFSKVLEGILNLTLKETMIHNPHISSVNLKFLFMLEFT